MTDLEVRRISWKFDETVPFRWHPTELEFGALMNAVGIIAVALEKYVVAATRDAIPLIADPAVVQEAEAFLRQEAHHAHAHRLHLRALIAQHPGLQQVLDDAIAFFDRLRARKPLKFHLAYAAALEASYTPYFKLILDNRATLLEPGDARVASLLAWHFVEEIEHRSSALTVFNEVVGRPWYRLWVLPRALVHMATVTGRIFDGFARHVPREVIGFDPRGLHPRKGPLLGLRNRLLPGRRGEQPLAGNPLASTPEAERKAMARGLRRSQAPHHDPADQPLPAFADEWLAAWRQGVDVTTLVGSTGSRR
ncbi:MAG TPA: metal-dependent hydrolase [Acidimicrobiales bacterium]